MVITIIWFSGSKPRSVHIFFSDRILVITGMIIHTFEIKSNLILISNPIRAYAYPKCKKPVEKTINASLQHPRAGARAGPGQGLGPGPKLGVL